MNFVHLLLLSLSLRLVASQVSSSSCTDRCYFCASGFSFGWAEISAKETIHLATIVEIVNTIDDTTRTSTIVNSNIPAGRTPPPTNADGTQIQTATYTKNGQATSTVLAFPEAFLAWPDTYVRRETFFSSTVSGTSSKCITTGGFTSTIDFTSFPAIESITTPIPSNGVADPNGLLYQPKGVMIEAADINSFFTDPVFQTCRPGCAFTIAPEPALTIAFVTLTTTSYEAGTSGSLGSASSATHSSRRTSIEQPTTTTDDSTITSTTPLPSRSSIQPSFTQSSVGPSPTSNSGASTGGLQRVAVLWAILNALLSLSAAI